MLCRFTGAKQWASEYAIYRTLLVLQFSGCSSGHLVSALTQVKMRKTPVDNGTGIVHFAMANEVNAIGGHRAKSTLG
jgi:hypothetical protein